MNEQDLRIEDVSAATENHLISSVKAHPVASISLLIVVVAVAIFSIEESLRTGDLRALSYNFFTIVALGIYASHIQSQIQETFMEQFAQDEGMMYLGSAPAVSLGFGAALFTAGHSQRVKNLVVGSYKNTSVRIFDYSYVLGYGKNSHTQNDTVYELTAPFLLPHIQIIQKGHILFTEYAQGEGVSHANLEKVQLEGDFNQYFDVYADPGAQIPLREILTPDIMTELIDSAAEYSFEFMNSSVLIYVPKIIGTKEEIDHLTDLSGTLVKQLAPVLSRL